MTERGHRRPDDGGAAQPAGGGAQPAGAEAQPARGQNIQQQADAQQEVNTQQHPGGTAHAARPRTRAEQRTAQLDTSPTRLLAEIDELKATLAAAQQEAGDNRAGWQRATADFMNYRRRTEQDRQANLGLANEALLSKLLAIADDFDRAVAHVPPELAGQGWVEGIVAIDRKLRQLLESEGVTPIEAQGRPFDPHEHEAVVEEETAQVPEGTVTTELQRGYRIRDRVLRPAMVAVAKSPAGSDGNRAETQD